MGFHRWAAEVKPPQEDAVALDTLLELLQQRLSITRTEQHKVHLWTFGLVEYVMFPLLHLVRYAATRDRFRELALRCIRTILSSLPSNVLRPALMRDVFVATVLLIPSNSSSSSNDGASTTTSSSSSTETPTESMLVLAAVLRHVATVSNIDSEHVHLMMQEEEDFFVVQVDSDDEDESNVDHEKQDLKNKSNNDKDAIDRKDWLGLRDEMTRPSLLPTFVRVISLAVDSLPMQQRKPLAMRLAAAQLLAWLPRAIPLPSLLCYFLPGVISVLSRVLLEASRSGQDGSKEHHALLVAALHSLSPWILATMGTPIRNEHDSHRDSAHQESSIKANNWESLKQMALVSSDSNNNTINKSNKSTLNNITENEMKAKNNQTSFDPQQPFNPNRWNDDFKKEAAANICNILSKGLLESVRKLPHPKIRSALLTHICVPFVEYCASPLQACVPDLVETCLALVSLSKSINGGDDDEMFLDSSDRYHHQIFHQRQKRGHSYSSSLWIARSIIARLHRAACGILLDLEGETVTVFSQQQDQATSKHILLKGMAGGSLFDGGDIALIWTLCQKFHQRMIALPRITTLPSTDDATKQDALFLATAYLRLLGKLGWQYVSVDSSSKGKNEFTFSKIGTGVGRGWELMGLLRMAMLELAEAGETAARVRLVQDRSIHPETSADLQMTASMQHQSNDHHGKKDSRSHNYAKHNPAQHFALVHFRTAESARLFRLLVHQIALNSSLQELADNLLPHLHSGSQDTTISVEHDDNSLPISKVVSDSAASGMIPYRSQAAWILNECLRGLVHHSHLTTSSTTILAQAKSFAKRVLDEYLASGILDLATTMPSHSKSSASASTSASSASSSSSIVRQLADNILLVTLALDGIACVAAVFGLELLPSSPNIINKEGSNSFSTSTTAPTTETKKRLPRLLQRVRSTPLGFQPLLHRVLYSLLDRVGDPNRIVRETAITTVNILAAHCMPGAAHAAMHALTPASTLPSNPDTAAASISSSSSSISTATITAVTTSTVASSSSSVTSSSYLGPADLVLRNVDYVLDTATRQLRRPGFHPRAVRVLRALIEFLGAAVLPFVEDPLMELMDKLDDLGHIEQGLAASEILAAFDALVRAMVGTDKEKNANAALATRKMNQATRARFLEPWTPSHRFEYFQHKHDSKLITSSFSIDDTTSNNITSAASQEMNWALGRLRSKRAQKEKELAERNQRNQNIDPEAVCSYFESHLKKKMKKERKQQQQQQQQSLQLNDDDDNLDEDDEENEENSANDPPKNDQEEDSSKKLSKAQKMCLDMLGKIEQHLFSPSARTRMLALQFVEHALPVMSTAQDALFPYVHRIWPLVINRLRPVGPQRDISRELLSTPNADHLDSLPLLLTSKASSLAMIPSSSSSSSLPSTSLTPSSSSSSSSSSTTTTPSSSSLPSSEETHYVVLASLDLVATLATHCGDFLRSRVEKDLWPRLHEIIRLWSHAESGIRSVPHITSSPLLPSSTEVLSPSPALSPSHFLGLAQSQAQDDRKHQPALYQYSFGRRLHLKLLQTLTKVLASVGILNSACIRDMTHTLVPFLWSRDHEISRLAVDVFLRLAKLDADIVWLCLCLQLGGFPSDVDEESQKKLGPILIPSYSFAANSNNGSHRMTSTKSTHFQRGHFAHISEWAHLPVSVMAVIRELC